MCEQLTTEQQDKIAEGICPNCGAEGTLHFEQATGTAEIVRCEKCGHSWVTPLFTPKEG